jgi:hypothetical protein
MYFSFLCDYQEEINYYLDRCLVIFPSSFILRSSARASRLSPGDTRIGTLNPPQL